MQSIPDNRPMDNWGPDLLTNCRLISVADTAAVFTAEPLSRNEKGRPCKSDPFLPRRCDQSPLGRKHFKATYKRETSTKDSKYVHRY